MIYFYQVLEPKVHVTEVGCTRQSRSSAPVLKNESENRTVLLVKFTLFPVGSIHGSTVRPGAAKSGCSLLLFDSTVVHGLGFAHSFAGYFEGSPLVGGDTLVIGAQIWLHLFPNLLLGVQLFVWFT